MRNKSVAAEWLYGVLLYLYPKKFRAAYGQQMRLTFRAACQAAYRRGGAGGLLVLWLSTVFDLLKSALEEWARQGEIIMSKAHFIMLAGPLTIVVGLMWLAVPIGNFLLAGDETFLALWSLLFILSFVPMLFATIGTQLRFQQSVKGVGRLGMGLSVIGCAGVVVFVLASMLFGGGQPVGDQPLWINYVAVICVLSIRMGYLLFGVDALRYRLLPRWNLLPLLLGSTLVLSLPLDWFGVPAILPLSAQLNLPLLYFLPLLHFVVTGVCWVLLGIALTEQKQALETAAAM